MHFSVVFYMFSVSKIIDRYKLQQADDLQTLDLEEKTRNYLPHKKLLELVQSNLEEANVDGVSVDSLNSLEERDCSFRN
ncbi:hypothetical protein F2Q70_00010793 [Brassica cretica]|uniref:Uncharacterized protein n=1 Tax=Brassica cretica TaxID=69181 RepID=A0A8S9M8E7_BRACR|nr:hypothetical protein F2Q70_00010793 [Brassica cretica]